MTRNTRQTACSRDGARRRPPGPPGWPLLGHLLQARADPLRFVQDLARNHGDIVYFRIGIYTGYLLNHPDYFQHVLKYNHRNYSKENYNYRMLKPVLGEGLITAHGERWLHNRRLIQPIFHRRSLARFATVAARSTREMLAHWETTAARRRPFDLAAEMMELTLRIITESLFSTDIRSSAEIVRRSFTVLNEDIARRFKSGFVLPRWIPTPGNRAFKRARKELDRLVYEIIDRRRRGLSGGEDLLSLLMSAGNEPGERGMTDRQIRDEVMTLLLAGHETTANLLTWTCYLLAQHPDAARRLQEELNDRDPVAGHFSDLPYMKSVLQESLRLYPPVWIISRKAIGRDVIGGYTAPAGTTVTLCSYTLHRHPSFWTSPEDFLPERFMKEEASHPAYFPFGGGPRSCIGDRLAMMEAQLVLAMIFRRYRLRLAPGQQVKPEPLVTLRPRHGLKMLLEAR